MANKALPSFPAHLLSLSTSPLDPSAQASPAPHRAHFLLWAFAHALPSAWNAGSCPETCVAGFPLHSGCSPDVPCPETSKPKTPQPAVTLLYPAPLATFFLALLLVSRNPLLSLLTALIFCLPTLECNPPENRSRVSYRGPALGLSHKRCSISISLLNEKACFCWKFLKVFNFPVAPNCSND